MIQDQAIFFAFDKWYWKIQSNVCWGNFTVSWVDKTIVLSENVSNSVTWESNTCARFTVQQMHLFYFC